MSEPFSFRPKRSSQPSPYSSSEGRSQQGRFSSSSSDSSPSFEGRERGERRPNSEGYSSDYRGRDQRNDRRDDRGENRGEGRERRDDRGYRSERGGRDGGNFYGRKPSSFKPSYDKGASRVRPAVWEKNESPAQSAEWIEPWVELKYFSYNPAVFPRMLGAVSSQAKAGDLVNVYDKYGQIFGGGFWNPVSKTPLRIMHHGKDPITEELLVEKIKEAVRLRREVFKLDATTNAYRVLHGDSDGIGGLIVDKFADVLSLEVSTLGAWIRLGKWLPLLHELCDTKRHIISCDPTIAAMERIPVQDCPKSEPVRFVKIIENGISYEINFLEGHKTGFFCDQRDNRRRLASFLEGKSFLELCCYTGGFSLNAKLLGKAESVVGVDLDEKAIALAKRNANINGAKVNFVHADAFTYVRQMIRNGEMFDTVLLDPPKFVHGREEYEEGLKKYQDLNALGLQCVKPGGMFVTCSCSGLVSPQAFEELIIRVAQRQGRKLRILDISGPGYDHPYLSTYPEGRYLKVLWAIVE